MSQQQQIPFTPPRGTVPPGTPAWQSIPKPVRLAIWIWAVCVIVGTIGAAVGAALWFLVLSAALGQ